MDGYNDDMPHMKGEDSLQALCLGMLLIHRLMQNFVSDGGKILYDDGVLWPDDNGLAASCKPGKLDAELNDDGANWCSATTLIGAGPDTGTPGAPNDACGG